MRYDRTVIGYHGCSEETADQLLSGTAFKVSTNDYDWLGRGIYFWEWGENRAWRWAESQAENGRFAQPAVVGVVVQLGRCFDLMDTRFTHDLSNFFPLWSRIQNQLGHPLPRNRGEAPDFKGRFLDCAVINSYLEFLEERNEYYDTVRCSFNEGESVFEGAGILMESHIQVAVRNPDCILGVFRPTPGSNP